MSQLAALTACQMPFRFGFPSGIREVRAAVAACAGGRVCPDTATMVSAAVAPAAAAPVAARMPMRRRRMWRLLPLFAGGRGLWPPLFRARAAQDAGQGVIPLMACVLEQLVVAARQRQRDRERPRKGGRVRDRVLVVDQIGSDALEPLDRDGVVRAAVSQSRLVVEVP